MTEETVFMAGVGDIQAIRFDRQGPASRSFVPGGELRAPEKCHQSGKALAEQSTVRDHVPSFFDGLQNAEFEIRLVFRTGRETKGGAEP